MEKFNIGDRVYTSLVKYGFNNKGTITDRKIGFNGGYLYAIKLDNNNIIQVLSPYVYRVYEDETQPPINTKKK